MDIAPSVSLEGYTKEDSALIIIQIEKATTANHSWIADFKKYSKTHASFTIETELYHIIELIEDLAKLDIQILPENYQFEIIEMKNNLKAKDAEIRLILNMHFIQNQKDFRETK